MRKSPRAASTNKEHMIPNAERKGGTRRNGEARQWAKFSPELAKQTLEEKQTRVKRNRKAYRSNTWIYRFGDWKKNFDSEK